MRTLSKPCTQTGMSSPRRSIWSLFALMRQRRDLGQLNDRMLRDVGLSRKQAKTEADRPIWDVPYTWHD